MIQAIIYKQVKTETIVDIQPGTYYAYMRTDLDETYRKIKVTDSFISWCTVKLNSETCSISYTSWKEEPDYYIERHFDKDDKDCKFISEQDFKEQFDKVMAVISD